MNKNQEVVIAYLDPIDNEQEILNSGEEFPSFFGGLPVFLNNIEVEELPKCSRCSQNLKFLLQIYSPLDFTHAMYRCLYVFYCESKQCLRNQSSVRIFRMQSPQICQQQTFYYKVNPKLLRFSDEKPMIITPEIISPEENLTEMKEARKLLPKKHGQNKNQPKHLQQLEEDEDEDEEDDDNWEDCKEQNKQVQEDDLSSDEENGQYKNKHQPEDKLYEKFLNENKNKSKVEKAVEISELEDLEGTMNNNIDGTFLIYQHFLTTYENHIIRYCFNKESEPLFFSDKQQFTKKDISQCPICQSERIYECQINNSLLSFSKELYALEWGVIFIYSCPKSCQSNQRFIEEAIMIQYDDHQEQFSDVSFDSQQIKSEIEKNKKKKKNKNKNNNLTQVEEKKQADEPQEDDW